MDIGVDFGTTFSTVAITASKEKIETLKFLGDDLIPTVLYINKNKDVYIGNAAIAQHRLNIEKALDSGWLYKDIKRWVGSNKHNFNTYDQKMVIREYRAELVADYTVAISGVGVTEGPMLTIIDLIALFLKCITSAVFTEYGLRVTSLVCTVPADYNSYKRSFLLEASKKIDSNIIAVVNEPTAAALFSALELQSSTDPEHVIVYDFGGGTFDVSYLCTYGKAAVVVDTAGDLFLGGRDIDAAIARFISKRNPSLIASKIVEQCGKIKIDCCGDRKYTDHSIIHNNKVYKISFSEQDLNEVIEPLVVRSINLLTELLERNGLVKVGVSVVMVGGSSAIPKVQERVSKLRGVKRVVFDKSTFRIAVAVGAKVYIDSLVENKGLVLVDTMSHAILDELVGFRPKVIIGKGQVVPSTAEITYSFSGGELPVDVYEGEKLLSFLNEPTYKGSVHTAASSNVKIRYSVKRDGSLDIVVNGKLLINKFLPISRIQVSDYVYKDPSAEFKDLGLQEYATDVFRVYEKPLNISMADTISLCKRVDRLIEASS
ncbi:HSP70 [Yam asymptomatic virus 1]|uniref:HSP70 n=1 Tax=Yam asymptomatic virus 1 TaxID=2771210 RepID=A0A7H1JMH6_9CLOS|nr:HSP70 [Yam asymptomatic virus 1]QNT12723.1 HSP70 [Yam asymptomatic virus 1]